MPFANRKIVMTGASGGIGAWVADLLRQSGGELLTISRSPGQAGMGRYIHGDLSNDMGIAKATDIVARARPDVLINLAGVHYCGLFEEQSAGNLREMFYTNLIAPIALCQAAVPAMRQRGHGQIVNVGSMLGSIPMAHFASYSSSKAGLRAFSEALRRELVDTGITVTYVAPRAVRTAVFTPTLEKYAALTGMAIDQPRDVARAIVGAAIERKADVHCGVFEPFLARLNGLIPRVLDRAMSTNDRKVKKIFSPGAGEQEVHHVE
jgi:short-subunit dehydrogenase